MVAGSYDELLREGIRLFKSREYKKSIDIFLILVESDENNHKAWNALGVANSKLGNDEFANVCFKKAISLDPNNPIYNRNFNRTNIQKKPMSFPKKNPYLKKIPYFNLLLMVVGVILVLLIISVVTSYVIDMTPPNKINTVSSSKPSPKNTLSPNFDNHPIITPTFTTAHILEKKLIKPTDIPTQSLNQSNKYVNTVIRTPNTIPTIVDIEKRQDDETLMMYIHSYIPNIVVNVESIIQDANSEDYGPDYEINYEEWPYFQDKYELLKNNITKLKEKITPLKTSSEVTKDKEIVLEGLDHLFDSGAMIQKGILITIGGVVSDDPSRGPILTKDGINAGNIGVKMLRNEFSKLFNGERIPDLPKNEDIKTDSNQNIEYSYQSDTCDDYYGCPYCCRCDGLLERAKMAENYELPAFKSAYDDCISRMRYVSNLEAQRSRL